MMILSRLIFLAGVFSLVAFAPDIEPARGKPQWPSLLDASQRIAPEHSALQRRADAVLQGLLQTARAEQTASTIAD